MPKLTFHRESRLHRAAGLFLLLGVLAVLLSLRSAPVAAAGPVDWENDLVRLTNVDRTSNGLGALLPRSDLTGLARERTNDMLQRQYFAHYTPEGQSAGDMIGARSIPYARWGENLGYAGGHDEDIVSYLEGKWMASEGHRANILTPDYTHIGPGANTGRYKNADVKMFTVLFLTHPAGAPQPSAAAPPAVPQPPPQSAPSNVPAPSAPSSSRTFEETGKTVKGLFLDYWNGHGGLVQQGFPISEEFDEVSDLNGQPYKVQYFERAVFEYHPENQPPYSILLSQLGTYQYKQKYPDGAPNQQASGDNSRFFAETGKTIGGKFRAYWEANGGLEQQGFPISDEFDEASALDGKTYRVQYFERAVFEYHPENQPPFDVLLSQVGTFRHKAKYGE